MGGRSSSPALDLPLRKATSRTTKNTIRRARQLNALARGLSLGWPPCSIARVRLSGRVDRALDSLFEHARTLRKQSLGSLASTMWLAPCGGPRPGFQTTLRSVGSAGPSPTNVVPILAAELSVG
jgi:hypothetical protein